MLDTDLAQVSLFFTHFLLLTSRAPILTARPKAQHMGSTGSHALT